MSLLDALRGRLPLWRPAWALTVPAWLLSACVSVTQPADPADFAVDAELRQIAGSYRNQAEPAQAGAGASAPIYLSALIWPDLPELPHARIDTVEIAVVDETWVEVRALGDGAVLHQGRYLAGRDFKWQEGRVVLRHDVGMAGLKADEPVFGPYYETVELGLDTRGHGRSLQRYGLVGLGYLIVPLAVRGQVEARFVRVEPAP